MKLICLGDNNSNFVKSTKATLKSLCPRIRKFPFYLSSFVLSVGGVLSCVASPSLWQTMISYIL